MNRSYSDIPRRRRRRNSPGLGLVILIVLALLMVLLFFIDPMGIRKKDNNSNNTPTPTGPAADTTHIAENTPAATPTASPTPTEIVYSNRILFSENDAIYTTDISVELNFDSKDTGVIYYTLDGTAPSASSTLYNGPIKLSAASGSDIKVYQINAIAQLPDGSFSEANGHTYFVGEKAGERFSTLVFSIYGDEKELTAGPGGILYGDNVTKKGRDYERKVFIQAFNNEGVILSHFGGVRAYGGKSRLLSIPSLKIYSRKEYSSENKNFKISVFETPRVDKPDKTVKKYDKLVLRNGGDDFQSGMIRDELAHQIAKNAGFTDYESTVPVTVFLNGSYYGLMWLHESYCDDYFQNKYGEGKGEFIIVEGPEISKPTNLADNDIEKAAFTEYNTMYKKYAYADLTKDSTYKELCSLVDVENYLRYYAFQLYCGNFDWPNRNYKCYRYYAGEGEEYGDGVFDGRWRYLLHDMDNGLGMFTKGDNIKYTYDDWKDVTSSTLNGKKNERYAPLFSALMKRADCKKYFVDYTYELMNGAFSYDSVKAQMDAMNEARITELKGYYYPYLAQLKKDGDTSIWTSERYFQVYYDQILDFAKNRPEYAKKYLNALFK